MLLWLLKAGALYGISFLGWILIYFALFQSIVPPQQLSRQIHLIPNEKGQLTATIPIQNSVDNVSNSNDENSQSASVISQFLSKQSKKLRFSSSTTSASRSSSKFWRSGLKYDISLSLQYADRPEVADLGGILFSVVADDPTVITASTWQALRYEVPLHRHCRHLLELPWALWRGKGSVAEERVFLARDLELPPGLGPDRLTFSVNSLKVPLQGCMVQINGHLRGLAYWLYYWRVAGVIVVVGGGTAGTWLLITLGLIVEVALKLKSRNIKGEESDDEEEEGEGSVTLSTIELKEFEGLSEVSELAEAPVVEASEVVVMIDTDEIIEGLRKRRVGDIIEPITEEDVEEDGDQSVPNTP